jgi:hypothetical protein
MKFFLVMLILMACSPAFAQNLWERGEKNICVQTKTTVDDIKKNLSTQHGKDCDYLRDSTRIVIGSFFKCPDDKTYSYFRSKRTCELFFAEGKKDLLKFAPANAKNSKKWVESFGTCMETATQQQVNSMGLRILNIFCYCVAGKVIDKINGHIVKECSEKL